MQDTLSTCMMPGVETFTADKPDAGTLQLYQAVWEWTVWKNKDISWLDMGAFLTVPFYVQAKHLPKLEKHQIFTALLVSSLSDQGYLGRVTGTELHVARALFPASQDLTLMVAD